MWLPLLASGHGAEFLDAKFYFDDQGRVNLETTADYAGNPMIADEAEARAALTNALHLAIDDAKAQPLTDLAPLKLMRRDQPDPDSPAPRGPEDPQAEHKLLTATWQWRPAGKLLHFSVPSSSAQTVLFWMKEPGVQAPRWSMLISGDQTPAIKVPDPLPSRRFWWLLGSSVLIAAGSFCQRMWKMVQGKKTGEALVSN